MRSVIHYQRDSSEARRGGRGAEEGANAREVSMMTVVTSWPGVTLGGMVTSGKTVLGARRTNASLRARVRSRGNRSSKWGGREGAAVSSLQLAPARTAYESRWSGQKLLAPWLPHGVETDFMSAEMMDDLPTPSSPISATRISRGAIFPRRVLA